MQKRNIMVFVALLLLMVFEWWFVAGKTRVDTVRHFHGICNGGVGQPYQDFIHQLRVFYETGDTNKLGRALRAADSNSMDIYSVWPYDDYDAYRSSIRKVLE